MPNFVFTVNNINLLPYIMEDGLKWTRFDVEAPDTGRTLDGVMHRGSYSRLGFRPSCLHTLARDVLL